MFPSKSDVLNFSIGNMTTEYIYNFKYLNLNKYSIIFKRMKTKNN